MLSLGEDGRQGKSLTGSSSSRQERGGNTIGPRMKTGMAEKDRQSKLHYNRARVARKNLSALIESTWVLKQTGEEVVGR